MADYKTGKDTHMKLGFTVCGVDVTLFDTTPPTFETPEMQASLDRLDDLLAIPTDQLTDAEAEEYGRLLDEVMPVQDEE
jgi:hypothetical protein